MADSWQNPVSANVADTDWDPVPPGSPSTCTIDNNQATYAEWDHSSLGYQTDVIEFDLGGNKKTNKVRVYIGEEDESTAWRIWYYDGSWNLFCNGSGLADGQWNEVSIGSVVIASKFKIDAWAESAEYTTVNDFQYNQLAVRPLVDGSLAAGKKGLV